MPSLLDTIQSSMKSSGAASQPTGQETQKAASLAATAQTGKVAPSGGAPAPALSNLGEKAAMVQAQQSQLQLQQQATLEQGKVDQAATQQAQAFSAQQDQLSNQRLATRQKMQSTLKGMLQQQQEQLQGLSQQDQRSRQEQMGTLLRLSNDKYVTGLQQAGQKARIDNEANFKEQLAGHVFDDERELLQSNLEFQNLLHMEHRDAMRELSNMSIDFALEMARADAKAAGQAAMATGFAGAVGGGAKAYADYKPDTTKQPDTSSSPTGNVAQSSAPVSSSNPYSNMS